MNVVYETDLRSLEGQQIVMCFQVCHSSFLRNEPTYQSLRRPCVICLLIFISQNFTPLIRAASVIYRVG